MDLNKRVLKYLILNAIIINGLWWFLFILGTNIGARSSNFFNNTLGPNIQNLYTSFIIIAIVSFTVFLIFNINKKFLFFILWVSILTPLFESLYYFILFCNGKADAPNMVVALISIGIVWFNFLMARDILYERNK